MPEDIMDNLVILVSLASGVPAERVIRSGRGRPAPPPETELYATYNLLPVRAYGHARKEREATDEPAEPTDLPDWYDWEETTIAAMECIVSINMLNDGARGAAFRFPNANYRQPVRDHLHSMGAAWRYVSEPRRLTALQQGGVQSRYQIDVHLWIETRITDTVLRAAGFGGLVIEDEQGNILLSED
jgi:hypothetical protein